MKFDTNILYGRTIARIEVDGFNNWIITFTDGSQISMESEQVQEWPFHRLVAKTIETSGEKYENFLNDYIEVNGFFGIHVALRNKFAINDITAASIIFKYQQSLDSDARQLAIERTELARRYGKV